MAGGLIATAKRATWRLGRSRSRSIIQRKGIGNGVVELRLTVTATLVVVELIKVARVIARVIANVFLPRLLAIIGLLRAGRVAHGLSAVLCLRLID
jgi:hypothetical protein